MIKTWINNVISNAKKSRTHKLIILVAFFSVAYIFPLIYITIGFDFDELRRKKPNLFALNLCVMSIELIFIYIVHLILLLELFRRFLRSTLRTLRLWL